MWFFLKVLFPFFKKSVLRSLGGPLRVYDPHPLEPASGWVVTKFVTLISSWQKYFVILKYPEIGTRFSVMVGTLHPQALMIVRPCPPSFTMPPPKLRCLGDWELTHLQRLPNRAIWLPYHIGWGEKPSLNNVIDVDPGSEKKIPIRGT